MTNSQRTIHKIIWIAILLLFPLLGYLALNKVRLPNLKAHQGTAIPSSAKNYNYNQDGLAVRRDGSNLLVDVYDPFSKPSALIFGVGLDNETRFFIGKLEGVGRYVFSTMDAFGKIVVVDEIKEQQILEIEL